MPALKLWWAIPTIDQTPNQFVPLYNWAFNAVIGKIIPPKQKIHAGGSSQKLLAERIQEVCQVNTATAEKLLEHVFPPPPDLVLNSLQRCKLAFSDFRETAGQEMPALRLARFAHDEQDHPFFVTLRQIWPLQLDDRWFS
ncbi:hypothetical protein JCM1841_006867, partial [Sporobolomyces salmonicolor]